MVSMPCIKSRRASVVELALRAFGEQLIPFVQEHLHLGDVLFRINRIENAVDLAAEEGGGPGVCFQISVDLEDRLADGGMRTIVLHDERPRGFERAGMHFALLHGFAHREGDLDQVDPP